MKVLIHPHVDIWQYVVKGLSSRTDVKCFALNKSTTKVQQIFRKAFSDKKIPSFCVLGSELRKVLSNLNDGDTVVLADYTDICLLNAINQCVNCKVNKVSWFWNPIKDEKRIVNIIPIIKSLGFRIHTFDKHDSKKYDLILDNQFFPILNHINEDVQEPEIDFYFAGFRKDRGCLISEILEVLSKYKTDFLVADTVADCISYENYIDKIRKTKCIVEIVQGAQSGLTLRPLEAIAFKKKLFTTNFDIVNQPFYNQDNIFIWGKDDISTLENFLNNPRSKIEADFLNMYDVNTWINELF